MSREIESDYDSLLGFFGKYELKENLLKEELKEELKRIHKKIYSYMVIIGEFSLLTDYNELSLLYHKEVISDLIEALFCWFNGTYKPAKLLLRSSIENYVKAMTLEENNSVLTTKNVYEVFELSKNTVAFSNEYCINKYNIIHSIYSDLCATVHGSIKKMDSIGGLISFPCYEKRNADEIYKLFICLLDSYLECIFFLNYKKVYHVNELNRELFLKGLRSKEKGIIHVYHEG